MQSRQSACRQRPRGGNPSESTKVLKNELAKFFEDKYRQLLAGPLESYENMKTAIDYQATEYITNLGNNIQQRFVEYVARFVNVKFDKKQKLEAIRTNKSYEAQKHQERSNF